MQPLSECADSAESMTAAVCLIEKLLGSAGGRGNGVGEAMHGPKHGDALVSAWRHALQLGRILPVVPCSSAYPSPAHALSTSYTSVYCSWPLSSWWLSVSVSGNQALTEQESQ